MKTVISRQGRQPVPANDYTKEAKAARLLYVCDTEAGITRHRRGKGFAYQFEGKPVRDKLAITRFRKLAIPPAWTRVWICSKENGHIQATGYDARGRKQYRYHPLWNAQRSETKFHKLLEFGSKLSLLRSQVEKDLSLPGLPEQKVIAALISLMEKTSIRIGNTEYEKANGSHGLTTLHDKHVQVNGPEILFSFRGKKGIGHKISLRNQRLARIVQRCRCIPGKELFQYYDDSGQRVPVDSGMVNRYIQQQIGESFSAKDFRTWAGSVNLLRALQRVRCFSSETECNRNINQALDEVSIHLGNTRTVCRKYYIHPGIIRLYKENRITNRLAQPVKHSSGNNSSRLSAEEHQLMLLLEMTG